MFKTIAASSVLMLAAGASQASLVGTELSLGNLNQVTPTSEVFFAEFPATATVSETEVEFPSADSLFGDSPRPPDSFIVDTSIDSGSDFLEIDFDNAGSGRFANWFQNTYVFGFSSEALVSITGAEVDRTVSNLAISDSNVSFSGDELFVNVTNLPYNSNSLLRIGLQSTVGPAPEEPGPGIAPVPLPAGFPLLAAGLAVLMGVSRRRQSKG